MKVIWFIVNLLKYQIKIHCYAIFDAFFWPQIRILSMENRHIGKEQNVFLPDNSKTKLLWDGFFCKCPPLKSKVGPSWQKLRQIGHHYIKTCFFSPRNTLTRKSCLLASNLTWESRSLLDANVLMLGQKKCCSRAWLKTLKSACAWHLHKSA